MTRTANKTCTESQIHSVLFYTYISIYTNNTQHRSLSLCTILYPDMFRNVLEYNCQADKLQAVGEERWQWPRPPGDTSWWRRSSTSLTSSDSSWSSTPSACTLTACPALVISVVLKVVQLSADREPLGPLDSTVALSAGHGRWGQALPLYLWWVWTVNDNRKCLIGWQGQWQ